MIAAPLISLRKKLGFSLLEMMVAMGVLSLMMVFLFNLLGQTMQAWDAGNRRVELAQAARTALDTVAQDLQYAIGGSGNAAALNPGAAIRCIVPFYSQNNATSTLGLPSDLTGSPSSGHIFVIAPRITDNNQLELAEIGYMSAFVNANSGYAHLRGRRYALLRSEVPTSEESAAVAADFFYRTQQPTSGGAAEWSTETRSSVNDFYRVSLVPNCYQIRFSYARLDPNGRLEYVSTWSDTDVLPAGVIITIRVMTEKTAARIAQLRPSGLTADDLNPSSTSDVSRVLREGSIEITRFVPFLNSRT